MSNKTYDILKYIAQIVLPALAALWLALAKIWNLPFGAEIGATISAIDLFLGAILKISSNSYLVEEAVKKIEMERTDTDRRDDSEVEHAEN